MIKHVLFSVVIIFKVSNCFNGLFWHISDIHLNSSNVDSSTYKSSFGDYYSDSPLNLVKSAIEEMHIIQENPDFIIWNGDNGAHKDYSDISFMETIKKVSKLLRDRFPSTNILPSLGNHDLNPSNNIYENSNWCEKLFIHWEFFFNNSSKETESFKRGCFYSRIVNLQNTKVKVIVLNTIIWYNFNDAAYSTKDPFDQFKWMKSELEDSRNKNHKVFIVSHVPPGASEYTPKVYKHLRPAFNELFLKILQNNSDIIEAGFFAHQHTDTFKVVYDIKGKPVIPLFLSPSVTPFHLRGLGSVNPSIRLYSWTKNVSQRHYSQFHAQLPSNELVTALKWSLEYNSTDLIPNLSAAQLDRLLTDFSSKNSSYFSKYFEYHLSGRPHDFNETCPVNSVCRCTIVCGMKYIIYNEMDLCLSKCSPNYTYLIFFIVVVIIPVIIIFAVFIYHTRRKSNITNGNPMVVYSGNKCEQNVGRSQGVMYVDGLHSSDCELGNSRTLLTLDDDSKIAEKNESIKGY